MMRCCLLAWDYPPSPSGLSTAASEIAQSLASEGCDMTVVTLDRTGVTQDGDVRVVGARIGDGLRRLRRWGGAGHLAAPIAFRRAVMAEHDRAPFDIVEATNWYAPAALLPGRAGMTLVTRNSTPAAYSRGPAGALRDRIDNGVADRLERAQARGSDGLISNTPDHGARMAAHYAIRAGTPHAMIGLSLPPELVAAGRAAGFPDDKAAVTLLFVGRAEARKGFPELMEAAAILAAEVEAGALPEFELRLLGVPPEDLPESLPQAARRRIRALGRQPQAALLHEYATAHLVVAPSRYESFGLVYQEALAFGRAVVASATDASARAFVAEGGVLAAETSAGALAEALRLPIASHVLRMAMRERAFAAAGRFTRRSLARATLDLYRAAQGRAQSR